VPLATARLCLEAIHLAGEVARKGNVSSASDAGVAALVARAGVEGAALNVLINLGVHHGCRLQGRVQTERAKLVEEAARACEETVSHVKGTFQ